MCDKRWRTYCCVYGCLNNSSNTELSLFRLPSEEERRLQWLRLIDREDLTNRSNPKHVVCEAHFHPEDIMKNSVRKLLRKNCLPSLNLPTLKKVDKCTQVEITTLYNNISFTQKIQYSNKSDDEESDGCSSFKDRHDELPLVEQPLETDAGNEPELFQQDSGDVSIKMEIIEEEDNPIVSTSKFDPTTTKTSGNRRKRKLSCDNNETTQTEPGTSATQLLDLNDINKVQNEMEKEINEFTNFLTCKFKTYSLGQFREVEGKIRKILLEADVKLEIGMLE